MELHFLLREEDERGGFPADETWDMWVNWNPDERDGCKLSVSPVNDEIYELAAETGGDAAKLMVVVESFLSMDPFLRSSEEVLGWVWKVFGGL